MKLILTGGTGFVGKYLLNRLLEDKAIKSLLLILRSLNKLDKKCLKNKKIKALELDLVKDDIPEIPNYDILVHLADVIPSQEDALNFSDNVKIAENIVRNIVLKKRIKKVIYTSTLDVYGKPKFFPISESHPTNPLTLYGVSKLANETFIKKAAEMVKADCIILRLSQVYGFGEPLIKVVPILINKIVEGKKIILNNNGNTVRDWVYIKDVISAIEKSIYCKSTGVFNIATGKGYSLRKLVELLGKITHKTPQVELKKNNTDPRPKIILSVSRARRYLKYYPQYTLEKGLNDYLAAKK